ncbi:MAG: hypothetical protein AAGF02_14225 [Actinomycetota bacterium]
MRRGVTLALAALALLAACGDGDDDGVTAAPIVVEGAESASGGAASGDDGSGDAAPAADDEALALEFADCMRAEGIDYVDPDIGADGSVDLLSGFANVDPTEGQDEAQAAFDVCGEILDGSTLLPDGSEAVANEDALLEFAQCLRDQGLDVEDPDVNAIGGGGGGGGPQALFGENFDPFDPDNQPMLEVCAPIMADAGLGPGAG